MKEFLIALIEADRVLQEATDFLIKHKRKIAGEKDKELAQKLISLIKSVITLLEKYSLMGAEVNGFEPHDISSLKTALESLQINLGAI